MFGSYKLKETQADLDLHVNERLYLEDSKASKNAKAVVSVYVNLTKQSLPYHKTEKNWSARIRPAYFVPREMM